MHLWQTASDLYSMGAIMSQAQHAPKELKKVRPGYREALALEDVPAMLRPGKKVTDNG